MMQIIYPDVFVPYDFKTVEDTYQHIYERCVWNGILQTHSLKLISRNRGHLELRCPIIGDYIDVFGTPAEIRKLYKMIEENELFSKNPI